MRLAETVTFGGAGPGGGFDRAAVERGTAVSLAAEPGGSVVLFWRGKPLIAGDALARLTPSHPVVQGSPADWVFLGRADGAPVFAAELAGWAPDGVDPAALDSFSDTTRQAHPALPADHAFAELRAVMTLLSPREAELAATARALFRPRTPCSCQFFWRSPLRRPPPHPKWGLGGICSVRTHGRKSPVALSNRKGAGSDRILVRLPGAHL